MTVVEWFRTIAFMLQDDEPGRPFQRYTLKVRTFFAPAGAGKCLPLVMREFLGSANSAIGRSLALAQYTRGLGGTTSTSLLRVYMCTGR